MSSPLVIICVMLVYDSVQASLSTQCGSDKFPCNDGSCIEKVKWCDTIENCADESDELYCSLRTTFRANPNRCDQSVFFLCKDGQCIPINGRCDGYPSCGDNSDEEDCEKSPTNQTTVANEALTTEVGTQVPEVKHKHQRDLFHHPRSNASQNKSQEFLKHSDVHIFSNKNHSKSQNITSNLQPLNDSHIKNFNHSRLYSDVGNNSAASKTTDSNLNGSRTRENEIPLNVSHHRDNLEVGFVKLNSSQFKKERSRAQNWLLKARDINYGWGDETARAITALYMSDDDIGNKLFSERMLMSKELNLKLFTALQRNGTKPILLEELSLFINSLSASCENPRNFYGQDLVNILRIRTNNIEASSVISPFVILTLCLNNITTDLDVVKLRDFVHDDHHIRELGIDALMSLASTCISRSSKQFSNEEGKQMAKKLFRRVVSEGLPESIYDLALVTQALYEAGINQAQWNRSEAIRRILRFQQQNGSFGDILSTYYVMPLLAGRSLLSLGVSCRSKDNDLVPVEVLKFARNEKIHVSYSLYFRNPPETTQTLAMKVNQFSSLFDVMRIAETKSPSYKFKYVSRGGKPRVYSIGEIVDDAEKGLYWSLYLKHNEILNGLEHFEGDIRNLTLKTGQHFVFWFKSAL